MYSSAICLVGFAVVHERCEFWCPLNCISHFLPGHMAFLFYQHLPMAIHAASTPDIVEICITKVSHTFFPILCFLILLDFGMTNSPPTFQHMTNNIFNDLYAKLIVSLDDLMVFTKGKSWQGHRAIVKEVLQCLYKNNLFAKPEKCVFSADKVDFLGMTIEKGSVGMQIKKVNIIFNCPAPTKLKQL